METQDPKETKVEEKGAEETVDQVEETPTEEKPEITAEAQEEPAEVTAEVPSTDSPEKDSSEEESPKKDSPSAFEEDEATIQSQKDSSHKIVQDIIADTDKFEDNVESASPQELVFLMEQFSNYEGEISEVIPLIGTLKRAFSKARPSGEDIDQAVVSRYNTAMAKFNKAKESIDASLEEEKTRNSEIKKGLLEELKAIVEAENVNAINEVRAIQEKWKNTGWIQNQDIESFGLQYKHYLDIFYNLRSRFHDLLDIDRKHNLDEKKSIIEEIKTHIPGEGQISRESWKEASDKVAGLQEYWKTVGHIPREVMDEINDAYRAALDHFYGERQKYYELLDGERKENTEKKQSLLEQFKAFSELDSNRPKEWNNKTRELIDLQKVWMAIGPGTSESNKQLWKDYRGYCDKFFERKSEFFKSFDEQRTENLKLKEALCEKAEALKDSEDWRKTASEYKRLQEEWKKVGPVHERFSNKVWKRFRAACDHFFNRREEAFKGKREEEKENLKIKEAVIADLKALPEKGLSDEELVKEFNQLQGKWHEVGHVPFKEKDKVYKAYKAITDELYKHDAIRSQKAGRLAGLQNITVKKVRNKRVDSEMSRLDRQIYAVKQDLSSYETNIQMISKGKSGDGLRKMIQTKIDSERAKLEKLEAKMKELKYLKNNPPKKKEEAPKAEKKAEPQEGSNEEE